VKQASSAEAAEGRFNLGIGCKLAALGLGEALEHIGKVRGVDLLRLGLAHHVEYGERNFVLAFYWQLPHRFERFIRELGHARTIRLSTILFKGGPGPACRRRRRLRRRSPAHAGYRKGAQLIRA